MPTYTLPELPYDLAALEPHYSAEVLELHHDKHHAAYVKGANDTLEKLQVARQLEDFDAIVGLEKSLAFNVSGHVLHSLFWRNPSPDGGGRPEGELAAAIDVWEHAFYLQYKNVKADYVDAIWNLVNWVDVSDRFERVRGLALV